MGPRRKLPRTGAVVIMAAALILAACGGGSGRPSAPDAEQPAIVRRQVNAGGMDRAYRLFTPPTLDEEARPLPLVLALHGSFNSADSLVESTKLDEAARANEFLVAYPEAEGLLWNGGFCCTGGRGSAAAHVEYLEEVIGDAAAIRRVDSKRVYAVGVSAGGVMAYRLGCDLAGQVAGVASVTGTMLLDDCHPSRPVSVLQIHGTADRLVPYQGGRVRGAATQPAPPTPAVVERWASLNGCPDPAVIHTEGIVSTMTWTGCREGTQVRLVTIEGGGHNWFAKDFGLPNGAVDATETMVSFFGLARRP